ncbi:hypothetical protein AB0E59_40500 [Lentzea sp. NPDC034063]|uniref:hypothetical protein n=1 Tax=unclassified Lentzea TaxID=2643253 RepID=UPI0033D313EB
MKCCGRVLTEADLTLLDGDPELVSDDLLLNFVWHPPGCFDEDEYEAAWRRLAYRVVQVMEDDPHASLAEGLALARPFTWPENERAALRAQLTGAIRRAAGDDERWPALDALFQTAALLDESLTPWLRLVDTFPDEVVVHLVREWTSAVQCTTKGDYGSLLVWQNPTPGEEMREWLFRPALRDRLSGVDSEAAQDAFLHVDWFAEEFSTR